MVLGVISMPYVALPDQIEKLEKSLLETKKKLVELRREAPGEKIDDYTFLAHDSREVSLRQLFGDKKELLVVHNMGKRCVYCTLWADGINGVIQHLQDRAAFVMVSPDPPDVQYEFAAGRGWQFPMVSYGETTFARDLRFQGEDNMYWPGVSALYIGEDGEIYRSGYRFFGPGDDFCSVWHFLDLLPRGNRAWEPKFSY